jgi:hypothetical protein
VRAKQKEKETYKRGMITVKVADSEATVCPSLIAYKVWQRWVK